MKVAILVILLVIGVVLSVPATAKPLADYKADPEGTSEYITDGRIVKTSLDEGVDVFTDTRTGCQYMEVNRGNYGRPMVKLGCFDEYKKPVAK